MMNIHELKTELYEENKSWFQLNYKTRPPWISQPQPQSAKLVLKVPSRLLVQEGINLEK